MIFEFMGDNGNVMCFDGNDESNWHGQVFDGLGL